jgi:3-deoxy-manno-octulosonate cytidylyltransferase (CMP-KDO synthetase)
VKVVTDTNGNALYFSRTPIPYIRSCEPALWLTKHCYLKHIGIYAYRTEVLKSLVLLGETPLEQCEKLEQLRWLEDGRNIAVIETRCENIGIDTPEDLLKAREFIKCQNLKPLTA